MDPDQNIKTRNVEHKKSLIRICGLNVCGLNSKLNNGILNDYIKDFDILSVYETKVAKGTEIDNFTVFDLETKPKEYRLPGVHGLSVYVSNQLSELCTRINEPEFGCDSVLWIKVSNYFILGTVYMPVEKPYYQNTEQYTELSLDIFSIKADYNLPIILIGDFNGRTGVLNDILLLESNDKSDIDNYDYPDILETFNSLNVPVHRTNIDKKTNNNGKQIIEMCKLTELCILNGRFGADKNLGKTTYDNVSTIDYAMCTPNLFANITDFSVDIFDRLLSDIHSPINITINVGNKNGDIQNSTNSTNSNDNIGKPIVDKVKWDDSREEDYKKAFDMNKINSLDLNLDTIVTNGITTDGIEEISKKLNNILLEPAKNVGMCKSFNPSSKFKKPKNNKPWFNNDCQNSKRTYWKLKRSLSKTNNTENTTLKNLAKQHKKLK